MRSDVPQILGLIRALAEYEESADQVRTTEADLERMLIDGELGAPPLAHALVAQVGDDVIGFALWFVSTSTWTGTHGIWLEDLFVRPDHRGAGIGRDLLARLAAICRDRGYARLEWWVLDWNTPAIEFYSALGSVAMDEWTVRRLDGAALESLASSAEPPQSPKAAGSDGSAG